MNDSKFFQFIQDLALQLETENIPYSFTKSTSLWLQGVEIEHSNMVYIEIQWDLIEKSYTLFDAHKCTSIEKKGAHAAYQVENKNVIVHVQCTFNTTIKTEPYRIQVQKDNATLWCVSIYKYLNYENKSEFDTAIHEFLRKKQHEITEQNEHAWNQDNYIALLNRYGSPGDLADKIKENPEWRIHPFSKYLDDPSGKKVIHLMGSNGIKSVAMSLLGADVTVADFSKENEAFALELAKYAGVKINYIVSDVLSLPLDELREQYDIVLMELGVLHYLVDIQPLMVMINQLLNDNGKFILHEFHPISTKLITSTGKKHKVTGNYFDPSIEKNDVAFTKHMPNEEKEKLQQVLQRKWTLGEIITSIGQAQMMIEILEEEPNHKLHDIGLPKTFTIVAKKCHFE